MMLTEEQEVKHKLDALIYLSQFYIKQVSIKGRIISVRQVVNNRTTRQFQKIRGGIHGNYYEQYYSYIFYPRDTYDAILPFF